MFSGIIDNQARVIKRKPQGGQIRFGFEMKKKTRPLKLGESIAVNGVCLTAAKVNGKKFEVDVIQATLDVTTLSDLKAGSWVNTERSLRYGDDISGHFVTGHVDGCGKIQKIEKKGKNRILTISAPRALMAYITSKGSITIDGISLTVQHSGKRDFEIALVPHTLKETNFTLRKAGDRVNLEVDLVARYLKNLTKFPSSSLASKRLSIGKLVRQGF